MHISLSIPQFFQAQLFITSSQWMRLSLGLISGVVGGSCILALSVNAQIIPDNTLGSENSVVNPQQTIRGIPSNLIEGGAIRGGNLFHSFQEFNIPEGYGAYFANPDNIINIFSRVTGGDTSQILGRLGVLGNSNLFFINPNGIIFGSNASLDIAGSFVGSTANSIVFNNNFEFSASNPTAVPLLTINIPIGLQFGSNTQAIINRSQAENSEGERVGLQIQPNQTIALIGGNIRFEGGIITAEGGQIELGSVEGNNLININVNNGLTFDYSNVSRFQDITLNQGSILDVDGEQNGGIQIQGRNLLLTDGSEIDADNSTSKSGKDLIIKTSESVELVGSGGSNGDSVIAIAPFAEGNGGNLNITTQRFTIRDGGFIIGNVDENATGKGGNITINATELVELKGQTADKFFASDIEAGTLSNSPLGQAGNITITTQNLIIQDGGRISTSVARGSSANAGNITIKASKSVELSGTLRGGTASGGLFSQSNPGATGDAGTLTVDTQRLIVTDGAQLSISTQSSGNGGTMVINARESVEVRGGGLRKDGSRFNSGIFSSVGRQDIVNSTGKGGDIIINTGKLVVDEAPITANTFGRGDGGSVTLNVEQLIINNGGQIGVGSFGEGDGGTLTVNASKSIEISGSGQLFTPPGQTNIPIVNSSLFAASEGTGNAGNINVQAQQIFLDNGSTISAQTANGQGGNITLNLSDSLFLRNGSSITATAGTAQAGGDGGNINITAPYIIAISNDNSDISANAFEGKGGNISITTDALFGIEPRDKPTALNDITASSQFGTSGIIQINNPNFRPNIELAQADINPVDPSTLIAQNVCKKGSQSEFIITGRGGLPPNPTAPLFPNIIWEDLGQSNTSYKSENNAPLVEANNWHLTPTGQITLTASNSPDTQTLLEQGKQRYQDKKFQEAIYLWQNAANIFKSQGDNLNLAKTLSYLALAYQKLGQWEQSMQAITDSLQILKNNFSNPNSLTILAGALNNQGNLELELGRGLSALDNFKQAEKIYQQVGDEEGIIYSIFNKAYALQTLGLNQQALQLLYPLYQHQQQQPDSLIKANIYRNLGEVLQLVGNWELSETVLQKSLIIAQNSQAYWEMGASYLNLGNLARIKQDSSTLNYYQKAFNITSDTKVKLQAKINQLSYLIHQNKILAAQQLIPDIEAEIANLPLSQSKIYAQINYAQSLIYIAQKNQKVKIYSTDIIQLLTTTLQQAREIKDKRSEAYTLGYLGRFYQQNQQFSQAEELSQQALSLSESIQAEDIAYLWQWQLGQIFKAQGKQPEAIAFYTQAYNTLERLRQDLVGINPDIEFSFRETIEPLYRQLAELLLEESPSQTNLRQARNIIESLQLAELNNFFQDACTEASPQEIDQIDPNAAVIYSIILPNRLEIILSLAQQPLRHYSISVTQKQLEQVYEEFWASLNPYLASDNPLHPKQQLYNWLIRPFEQELKTDKINTIVTVLDGVLRGIPLAALHDGKQYLIENYNLALTPGLQLLESQSSSSEQLKTLVGGLAEARQGFSPLPGVKQEVQDIAQTVPAQILLNQDFTRSRLQEQLAQNSYPLVHLATHGQFSSVAEKTFLLTWDGQIKINELKDLLQRPKTLEPIKLLILSACQTATGDNRAALGLAGIAVRSGAQSTLATLWSVEDQSTAELMKQFYTRLSQPGMTKAQALRQAQLFLLHSSDYQHPYYWAPFVLVGNWL